MPDVKILWFPQVEGDFKIVQAYVKSEPVFAFQNRDRQFHSQLLEMVLRSYRIRPEIGQIPGDDPHDSDHAPVPLLEGQEYKVVGMGHAKISHGKLKLYGESYRYRIPIDEGHAKISFEAMKKLRPDLEYMFFQ